jgi:hypothetical protein
MPLTYTQQLEKIVNRFISQANGCWYLGNTKPNNKGYATTKIGWPNSKTVKGHKLSWIFYYGDIPKGMVIDHLCHDPKVCVGGDICEHRKCVNPEHLQLVTASENNAKTVRVLKFRTHCKNGHELKDNIYIYSNGKRKGCATCMNRSVKVGA